MNQRLSDLLADQDPTEVLNQLVLNSYEAPLSTLRDQLRHLPEALQTVILVSDFDTELNMNGVLGFLENSTGLYLPDTIEAFLRIGAPRTAGTLARIQGILSQHGVTTSRLREDLSSLEQYQITTFLDSHGHETESMADAVCLEAEHFYINSGGDDEAVGDLLVEYVANNKSQLLQALRDRGL
jgi:hypothetical protein